MLVGKFKNQFIAEFKKGWEDWTTPISVYDNFIKKMGNPITTEDKIKLVLAYYKKFKLSGDCGYDDLLKAISYLNVIIVAYPKETIFYIARATIYEHLSNYRSALDDCDRVLNIDPNCSEALYKKLKIMFMLNCGDTKPILKKLQLVCPMYATKEKEINKYLKKKAKP
jgi:tetratricopeptide (TPR) repeat protein